MQALQQSALWFLRQILALEDKGLELFHADEEVVGKHEGGGGQLILVAGHVDKKLSTMHLHPKLVEGNLSSCQFGIGLDACKCMPFDLYYLLDYGTGWTSAWVLNVACLYHWHILAHTSSKDPLLEHVNSKGYQ